MRTFANDSALKSTRHNTGNPELGITSSRSSNRTCEFPASGLQTKSCLRPRQAFCLKRKTSQAVLLIQPVIGKSHIFPVPHLVFSTQPPAKPLFRMSINRRIRWRYLTQTKVIRPARQHLIEAFDHLFRVHRSVACCRLLTQLAAYVLNTQLARTSANVSIAPIMPVVRSDTIAQKFQSLIRTLQASGLLQIYRQFQMFHNSDKSLQHLCWRCFSQNTDVICIIDNLRPKPLGISQLLPAQDESPHVDGA